MFICIERLKKLKINKEESANLEKVLEPLEVEMFPNPEQRVLKTFPLPFHIWT